VPNEAHDIISSGCLLDLTTTGCVFYTTGETEVGVRTRKFALTGKGVENKAYPAGSTYIFHAVYQRLAHL
jgi:hypothetical protein